jgi:hypothetical protein
LKLEMKHRVTDKSHTYLVAAVLEGQSCWSDYWSKVYLIL